MNAVTLRGLSPADSARAYATAVRIANDAVHAAIHGEVYLLALAHVLLMEELALIREPAAEEATG